MKGIVATDLDGTLLSSKAIISEKDISTLNSLKTQGFIRIIATGRSVYSIERILPLNTPIDYVVFSTGAGVYDWKRKRVLYANNLNSNEVRRSFELLMKYDINFTVQEKIPENHRYVFIRKKKSDTDFETRNKLYTDFSKEIFPEEFDPEESCQLLAITEVSHGLKICEEISRSLKKLKVIRSTSPLDHQSVWIEIFAKNVSKAIGVNYIADLYGITQENIMAVGNDYNDLDLLNWAGKSFVVDNSPNDLKGKYEIVHSNNHSGFSQAVNLWLKSKNWQ
ncbi:MAG: HAD-IIB family hydrolase [Bacteroidetes bacterium]|nr:HAD-IIB family hydrolase [Bacteroidota bacterium]